MQPKCKVCDNLIYEDEFDCPHCGAEYDGKKKPINKETKKLFYLFLFVVFAAASRIFRHL